MLLDRGDGEEHGGAAGWTIRSPEIRRRRAVAAAEKGPRRGHGREQEGEGKGGGEVRTLTLSTMEWPARAGEAGRRRGGAQRWRPEAEKTRTVATTSGTPAQFLARGGRRRRRGARGLLGPARGGRSRRRGAAAGAAAVDRELLGLGFATAAVDSRCAASLSVGVWEWDGLADWARRRAARRRAAAGNFGSLPASLGAP